MNALTIKSAKALPYKLLQDIIPTLGAVKEEDFKKFDDNVIQLILNTTVQKEELTALGPIASTRTAFQRFLDEEKYNVGISGNWLNGKFISDNILRGEYIEWCQRGEVKKEFYTTAVDHAVSYQREKAKLNEAKRIHDILSAETDGKAFNNMAETLGWSNMETKVLRWWIADVKRKINQWVNGEKVNVSGQVPYPVFYGGQGVGKTYLVKELREVMGELTVQRKVDDLMDNFYQSQYGYMLIVDFDDIGQVDYKDLGKLKSWITAEVLTTRVMHSESSHVIHKISSGICSSNNPIAQVFPDSTGSRRFFQIDVREEGYVDALKSGEINFEDVWASVPLDYVPSHKERDEIKAVQRKEQRKVSNVELWFEESYSLENFGTNVCAKEMFISFKLWLEDNSFKPVSSTAFNRNLEKYLGRSIYRKRTKSGYVYNLLKPITTKDKDFPSVKAVEHDREFPSAEAVEHDYIV